MLFYKLRREFSVLKLYFLSSKLYLKVLLISNKYHTTSNLGNLLI